jgi:Leucine-rich repeat (LRR) protein
MELTCDFGNHNTICFVRSCEITEPKTVIKSIVGEYLPGKTSNDVRSIFFRGTVNFVPRGITDIFPNLIGLAIQNCALKSVCREDFSEFTNLKNLMLGSNELTTLPENLFQDMPLLKYISFYNNQIDSMSSRMFKPIINNEITFIDLQKNTKIDALYCPDEPKSVQSVEELMKIIELVCGKPVY